MEDANKDINQRYEDYYKKRQNVKVYPTEFVVRTFLANYPTLNFEKPQPGSKILDMGFGDGRNTAFLCDLGFLVSGVEITQEIVNQTSNRLMALGHQADLRMGRNSDIPFEDECFDCILATHSCYYCDEGETLSDNLKEYCRVLKKNGYLIASIADKKSFIFKNADNLSDGTFRIHNDPYENRDGYRLQAFNDTQEIAQYFSLYFKESSFGTANNDYFGINERVFWIVCKKK